MLLFVLLAFASCDRDNLWEKMNDNTYSISSREITSFTFVSPSSAGTIDGNTNTITFTFDPRYWNVTSLTPTIIHTGADISPPSGSAQNFTNPVQYTVTARDGTVRVYTVTVSVPAYNLRDTGPAGGLIFYINPNAAIDGWKYLEAAPPATEWSSKEWGKFCTAVGGTGTAIGTGKNNTVLIVALLNSAPPDSDRAAQLCDALDNGGYSDWFLPSLDELDLMYDNLKLYGVGGFGNNQYWSSSESASCNADGEYFLDGTQANHSKNMARTVRAVRSF